MSGRPRKRKQRDSYARNSAQQPSWARETTTTEPDLSLFIQAHEADIARGPQAWSSAPRLEAENQVTGEVGQGGGLIQWDTSDDLGGEPRDAIWVDRYARPQGIA